MSLNYKESCSTKFNINGGKRLTKCKVYRSEKDIDGKFARTTTFDAKKRFGKQCGGRKCGFCGRRSCDCHMKIQNARIHKKISFQKSF